MHETVVVHVEGEAVEVARGTTVAAAVLIAGAICRTSVSRQPRTPLCGMGICFECRAVVNGEPHRRGCQVLCEPGMVITKDEC
jgi:D-hydroxyproline dehydrogenase subunit gamma